ncbi:MAG: B12-binding domain-containing radical SAM protein [Acidobacteriota bacterium]
MRSRGGPVYLVEPGINPITRRFGLPLVANYPPLALARLAGQMDHSDIRIVDLRVPGERNRFLRDLPTQPPGVVAISLTFTSNGDQAIELASAVRRVAPRTAIILGGTAASESPDSFLATEIDLICHRAGDRSLAELVAQFRRNGEVPSQPDGFLYRDGGGWAAAAPAKAVPMASLKPYAWHCLPRRYWRTYFQGFRRTGMGQTSEGCPYDCTFCSVWQVHGRKVNVASLENVRHDLEALPPGTRGFFFADDIWMQATETQRRELYDPLLAWLADGFLERHPDLWLTAETRTDLFLRQEPRFREWIRRGNLKRIFFGIEAATDAALAGFSKRTTVSANSQALRRASELGVYITAQFVIPMDADTAYFDEMVRFLAEHRPWISVANFTIATPLPGTEFYREVTRIHPEIHDRRTVSHPAFSLFTALTPTRLPLPEFYRHVARLYRVANRIRFQWTSAGHLMTALFHHPGIVGRLIRVPGLVKQLGNPATWLEVHQQVQGHRLFPYPSYGDRGVLIGSSRSLDGDPASV